MQLKVISDGTALGTKLVDAATGEVVQGVRSIAWRVQENGQVQETLVLTSLALDADLGQSDVEWHRA